MLTIIFYHLLSILVSLFNEPIMDAWFHCVFLELNTANIRKNVQNTT